MKIFFKYMKNNRLTKDLRLWRSARDTYLWKRCFKINSKIGRCTTETEQLHSFKFSLCDVNTLSFTSFNLFQCPAEKTSDTGSPISKLWQHPIGLIFKELKSETYEKYWNQWKIIPVIFVKRNWIHKDCYLSGISFPQILACI